MKKLKNKKLKIMFLVIIVIVGIFLLNAILLNIGRNKCTFSVDFDGMGYEYCPPNKLQKIEDRFRYWLLRTVIIPIERELGQKDFDSLPRSK